MTASTFLEAFPHAMLWLPSVRDAVLVGAREPLGTELTGLLAALRVPSVRASLDAAYATLGVAGADLAFEHLWPIGRRRGC